MENYLSRFWEYLINVVLSTANQLLFLFGILLVLVLLLSLSASFLASLSLRFLGRNIFLFGFSWLGTSIHELSHAFFALIFGHKITEIALFEPNKNGTSLGHVSHTYNKRSIYHKTGNFFIGIGPVLASGIFLFLATSLIFGYDITKLAPVKITSDTFFDIQFFKLLAINLKNSLFALYPVIFTTSHASWWKIAIFIYVLYSIGSSMTLSSSDVKSSLSGFIWVVLFFLLFNLLTLWSGKFISILLTRINVYITGFLLLLIISLLANLLFIGVLFFLNILKSLFVSRK